MTESGHQLQLSPLKTLQKGYRFESPDHSNIPSDHLERVEIRSVILSQSNEPKTDAQGQSQETFNQIFAKTLSLCLENLESYLLTCHDCIGILLMIKTTRMLSMVMQRRRVPVLDTFFDRVNMLLWPRFKTVFDNNLKR